MRKKNIYFALFAIIALGAFLRIYGLGNESFWIDESETAYVAKQSSFSKVLYDIYNYNSAAPDYFKGTGGGSMPLYFFISYYWTKIFGLNEFNLRLLSAIFGIMSIYLTYLLGKYFFNAKTGLIAAFIISINHQNIYYAQEARNYAMLIFFTLLSIYFLMRSLNENKKIYWLGYIICAVVLIYTHYLSFLILMFQYLYIFLFGKTHKANFKNAIISALIIFSSYIPWIPALMKQLMSISYPYANLFKPSFFNLGYVFVQINSWISPSLSDRIALRNADFGSISLIGWLLIWCVLLITALIASSFIFSLFKDENFSIANIFKNKKTFLLLWFLIPFLIPFIFSIMFPSMSLAGFVNYVMFVTPSYYILAAKGMQSSNANAKLWIILLILLSILPLYSYYANFDKDQWKEASQYLNLQEYGTELIIVNKPSAILALDYYYPVNNAKPANDVNEAASLIKGEKSFWLLYASEKFSDTNNNIKKHLDSSFKLDKQMEFTGIRLFHYTQ
ncbi:glycosyltransferase family 39 protein [Candidatus Woesearchaeota archaeon]|nr:glycosyltransferase family 39 protein [Candidatus Woesearchaeota archaeon]